MASRRSVQLWHHSTGDVHGEETPSDDTFLEGLSLHKLSKMTSPERVMEIADSNLIEESAGGRIMKHA